VADASFSESIPELTMVDGVVTANSVGSSLLPVTRERALSVPGVLRGRNLICGISTLPLRQYGPDQRVERSPLFDQFSRDVPNSVMLAMLAEDLLFDAIGWWHVVERGWNNYPTKVERVAPDRVHLNPPPGGEPLSRLPSGADPRAAVWIDTKVIPGRDMIRFDSLNPALLKAARRAIRRAIALEEAAEMYANDPRPLDYFTPAEGADPASDEDTEELLDDWEAARKQRTTAYVPASIKYNSVNQPTPADLQLVGLQQRAALDIANAIGLDPEDLGISTTSRTYQNATDRRRDRINDVLAQYMKPITDRLSMGDVTRQGYTVAFDLSEYLKADPRTQAEVDAIYHDHGALTPDEMRSTAGRPALTAAQKRELRPEPAPAAPPVPAAPPALEAPQMSTHAAATFSEDDAARGVVLDASPHATFALDRESRTILGLAVPWGQTARSDGRKFRFAPGSLTWSDVSRVKLLRDHNYSQAVGRAVALDSDDTGLWVRFKVAVGPEGDRVLALAAEGVLDGLSVGVFPPDGHDKIVGTIAADGTFDVAPGGGALREVSLCAVPAFDDSRVTSIAASSTERDLITMSDTATEQTAPAPAATSATFSATDLGEQIRAAVRDALGSVERPADVNPNRATLAVTEEAPYRFSGERGAHEFSSDVFDMASNRADGETAQRVEKFMSAHFAVATTDVNELNPTGNRPDMYVDQRSYNYPVWAAIDKGSISDNTPFTFPKFNSAGSLVADHTEGTEPGLGTFTTTLDTVTPAPLSGKVEVNREVIDQGGNPQVSGLIWRQMGKAWGEAKEAKAVALLAAASPTAITLTTAAADDALAGEIDAAFVALQYVRGGFTMDTAFAQIDLYKRLAAAVDSSGRKLFPILAPQNASGTARSRYSAIDVSGVTMLPAWALAATGSVSAKSYLFDRESVHGWASAPRKLDFDYQVKSVFIGIWGYAAAVISDLAGVRVINYDPTA